MKHYRMYYMVLSYWFDDKVLVIVLYLVMRNVRYSEVVYGAYITTKKWYQNFFTSILSSQCFITKVTT